jgi:ribonuclease P protein component
LSERRYRLTGVGAFEAIFRAGRRHEGRFVQLIAAPADAEVGRTGFVVGRKVLRRAVDRNRFKRLVRDLFRESRPRMAHLDVIVRLKRPPRREEIGIAASEVAVLLASLAAPVPR